MSINSEVVTSFNIRNITFKGGYTGVNIPDPEFTLHIRSTVDPAACVVEAIGIVGVNFIGRRARGTVAAKTAVQTNDGLFQLTGRGYMATGWSADAGSILLRAAENWTDAANGSYWRVSAKITGTLLSQEIILFKPTAVKLTKCDTFADNAAALLGGLVAGDLYKTVTGEVRIVV